MKKKERNSGKTGTKFSLVRQEDLYLTVDYFKGKPGYTVDFLCKTIGLPRSSYYKWAKRQIPQKEKQDNELANIIVEYQRTYHGILGYRRMTLFINILNHTNYSEKYIHRIMVEMGMQARIRRKRYNFIKSKPEQTAANIMNRDFSTTGPNQKWCTDVTEFKILNQDRKLYLSAIIDLYDRSIVAYVLSNSNNNKLVFDTFDLALKKNPGARPIFHSDRGYQYTSKQFKDKLDKAHMTQSMSRVGKCIDNGPMEGFWGTLKSEMYYGFKWTDEKTLRDTIEEYIKFYNEDRFQYNLNGMTPNEFRNHAINL